MRLLVPVIVAAVSYGLFFALGRLMRRYLHWSTPCRHQWYILIEKYPTFTQDRWSCRECKLAKNFFHDEPPVKTTTELCDMGHAHIVVAVSEVDEWPSTIG